MKWAPPIWSVVTCLLFVPSRSVHGQNPNQRLAEIKARRTELEKGFIAELQRLNQFLAVHDQMLQMQAASGTLSREEAVAQLKKKGIAAFERSFTAQEYQTGLQDLRLAGEKFFSMVSQKIDFASRWPADKSEAEYQQLAHTELAQARASFERLRQQPTESVKSLEQASKILGWSQGARELPPELKFFSGQAQRVIKTLADARVKTYFDLNSPAPKTDGQNTPLVSSTNAVSTIATVSNLVPIAADIRPEALAHYTRGVQLAGQGKWSEAEGEYRAALEMDGREGLFHLGLGGALLALGRPQNAEPSFRAAAQVRPNLKEAYQGHGNALYQLQRYEESAQAYQQWVRLAPQTAEPQGSLAYPLLMLRRWPEAETALREATRLAPGRADYWTGLGNVYYQTQRFVEAAQAYRQALRIEPAAAPGHLFLALSLEAAQQGGEAREQFRQAYGLDANNPQIAIEYANALARDGNWSEAEPVYIKAVRLNPQDPHGFRGLGHAKMSANQFAEAEKAYREAVRLNNQLGVFHADLAGALFRQNRVEEARAAAQQAAQLGFRDHWIFAALGIP